jgi:hypothetical protein
LSIIKIKCLDQTLTITNKPLVASGGQEENKMIFEFCSMWDGFSKTAVFFRNASEVYNVLIVNSECKIPNEVLQEEGKFYFGVYGVNGTQRRTSEVLTYEVTKGAYILGQEPSEPTPNIYTQMMDLHNEILSKYETIFADINSLVADAVLQGVVNQNNTNELVQFWFGTKEEYNAIANKSDKYVYIITGEETFADRSTNASNLTDTIRGVDIYDIFECTDGDNITPKVLNSLNADNSLKAKYLDREKNLVARGSFKSSSDGLQYYIELDNIEDDSTYLISVTNSNQDTYKQYTSTFILNIFAKDFDAVSSQGFLVGKYKSVTQNRLCFMYYHSISNLNGYRYLINPISIEDRGSIDDVVPDVTSNWLYEIYKIM